MGFTRDKSVLFAIVIAIVAVSTIIIITDHENSSAASGTYYVDNATDLKNTIESADANDVIVIVVTQNIELNETLKIQVKCHDVTLTTNNGAKISASNTFNAVNGWTENNLIDIVMNQAPPAGKQNVFKIGEENPTKDPNKILKLDGNNKCRVIRFVNHQSTLVINEGHITGGLGLIGGGLFLSYGANFEMYGGTVKGNNVDPAWGETDYIYSSDFLFSSGTNAYIYGGEIGTIFHRSDGDTDGHGTHIYGGTIDSIFIYGYLRNDGTRYASSFTYHEDPNYERGTIGQVLLADVGHNNDTDTFKPTKIKQPFENGRTLEPGDHVAKIKNNDKYPYGYTSLADAIEDAEDGDTIIILNDIEIQDIVNINKNVNFEIAPKYSKNKDPATGEFQSTPFIITYPEKLLFDVTVTLNTAVDMPNGWTKVGDSFVKKFSYGTQISDIVNSLETPTRTGYKFTGWSYTDGAIGTVSANITANYTVNSYKIHLHHGTDGFSHGTATVDFDSNSVLIHEIPKKIGHRLVGYFTHETDGTMVLNADGTFASDNVDDHITDGKWSKAEHHTLYAQWELDESSNINPMIIIIATAIEAAIVIGVTVLVRRR